MKQAMRDAVEKLKEELKEINELSDNDFQHKPHLIEKRKKLVEQIDSIEKLLSK